MDVAERTALADRYLRAWNARDVDGVLACMGRDVEWDDPAMPDRPCRGHEQVAAFLRLTWRAFPDFTVHATAGEEYPGPAADTFFVPWTVTGTFRGPIDPPGFAPTGQAFTVPGVDVWVVRDELLWRVTAYYNLIDVLRQIGVMPAAGSRRERVLATLQRLSTGLRKTP